MNYGNFTLSVRYLFSLSRRSTCRSARRPVNVRNLTTAVENVGRRNNARGLIPSDGLTMEHFLSRANSARPSKIIPSVEESSSYLSDEDLNGGGRKVKLVTYGCQMNVNDMEVVRALLKKNNYEETQESHEADVIMLMTCSIREGAEEKVWKELRRIRKEISRSSPTVAVLGCMAERVRHGLLDQRGLVDVVAGPDSYRDLPRLLAVARAGSSAINVQLSVEETYADVRPVRVDQDAKSAFVSIMRGCDNMCTYCVVPLTRGRERSRPIDSILEEVKRLSEQGVKQITLLGQNVNSYRDMSESIITTDQDVISTVPGFKTVYKPRVGGRTFLTLLEKVSEIDPEMRIRFTSPHPKDFPMEVIQLIKERPNICNQLHLPAQSGCNETLERMGRGYTRETYLQLVEDIRSQMKDVSLTSDFIAGFCGETEEGHQLTMDLMRRVQYSFCFVFPYSMREKTRAHYRLSDNVPENVKHRRHAELAAVFREQALLFHQKMIGSTQLVLVEGVSKRSTTALQGRADGGSKVIFENTGGYKAGDYVVAKINSCTSQTLSGSALYKTSLTEFAKSIL